MLIAPVVLVFVLLPIWEVGNGLELFSHLYTSVGSNENNCLHEKSWHADSGRQRKRDTKITFGLSIPTIACRARESLVEQAKLLLGRYLKLISKGGLIRQGG